MTLLLVFSGLLVTAMAIYGVSLLDQAGTEPAARGSGRAPDPSEEAEARDSARDQDRSERMVKAPD